MAINSVDLTLQKSEFTQGVKSWVVCLCAGLFFMYEFIQLNMFNAINDSLRQTFHLSATQLGLLSSTYLLADIIFLLPAGLLLDRLSTRKIIMTALSICIIGTFGFAVTDSVYLAAVFHFLSGCGNAFCFLSCIMLVSRWFKSNRHAFVIGLIGTLAFTGGLLAQTPLAWMASQLGWRQSLIYDGIFGLIILVAIFCIVEDYPPYSENIRQQKKLALDHIHFGQSLMMAITNRQNWLAGFYTCLLNLPIMVLDAIWGVAFLHKVHHLSELKASNVTAMIFIGSILGSPLAGWLSDCWGLRRKPMLISALLSLVSMSLVILLHDLSYPVLLFLFFCVGLFTSTQVITYPLVTESNPITITGTAIGFASLIIMGGAGIAQILFGQLLDYNWDGLIVEGQRIYTSANYNVAMLMFPIAIAIGYVTIWFARETFCHSSNTR